MYPKTVAAAARPVSDCAALHIELPPSLRRAGRPRVTGPAPTIVRSAPFVTGAVPFVDLVADPSSPLSMPTTTHWVRVPGRKLAKNDFVARVRGTSMEPDVPDGAICLFRQPVPKPAGKILLVERLGAPSDVGGQFFLKQVRVLASGRLRLVSRDPEIADVVGDLAPLGDLRIVAQLVDVLAETP